MNFNPSNYLNPLFIGVVVASLLTALGALLGWFGFGDGLFQEVLNDEMGERETIATVVGVASAVIMVVAASVDNVNIKRALAGISVAAMAYVLIMAFNQWPNSEETEVLDITTNFGYYLTLIGSLLAIVSAAAYTSMPNFTLGGSKGSANPADKA